MTDALIKNLSYFASGAAVKNSLETALTCRAVSSYLREKFPDDDRLKIFERTSLAAVVNSIDTLKFSDAHLLLSELPNLLSLPYPIVEELRGASIQVIAKLMDFMRENECWKEFVELDYLQQLLKK